jgi:hypothetical protein
MPSVRVLPAVRCVFRNSSAARRIARSDLLNLGLLLLNLLHINAILLRSGLRLLIVLFIRAARVRRLCDLGGPGYYSSSCRRCSLFTRKCGEFRPPQRLSIRQIVLPDPGDSSRRKKLLVGETWVRTAEREQVLASRAEVLQA